MERSVLPASAPLHRPNSGKARPWQGTAEPTACTARNWRAAAAGSMMAQLESRRLCAWA